MSSASPGPLVASPFLLCSHGRTAPTSTTMRMTMSTVPSTGDVLLGYLGQTGEQSHAGLPASASFPCGYQLRPVSDRSRGRASGLETRDASPLAPYTVQPGWLQERSGTSKSDSRMAGPALPGIS